MIYPAQWNGKRQSVTTVCCLFGILPQDMLPQLLIRGFEVQSNTIWPVSTPGGRAARLNRPSGSTHVVLRSRAASWSGGDGGSAGEERVLCCRVTRQCVNSSCWEALFHAL